VLLTPEICVVSTIRVTEGDGFLWRQSMVSSVEKVSELSHFRKLHEMNQVTSHWHRPKLIFTSTIKSFRCVRADND
jgi:hypothetical protein